MSKDQLFYPQGQPLHYSLEQYLNALLYGGRCLGYERLEVDETVQSFTIPEKCQTAVLSVEAGQGASDSTKIARFLETGDDPSANDGMPLGDGSILQISGKLNLDAFKVIGLDAGVTHIINIQYYGPGNA